MAKMQTVPRSYYEAAQALGGKNSRKIGHNTELVEYSDQAIEVTYHGNAIVRYTKAGMFISWAGWETSTTTNRLNQFAPADVRAHIKRGDAHINNKPVDPYAWHKVG